ncbi:MAG: hypothetical protein WD295_00420, partial [Bacteroidota bacterium]
MQVREVTCGGFATSPISGSHSLTIPVQGGAVFYFARLNANVVSNVRVYFRVYLDEALIQVDSLNVNCASNCQVNWERSVGLNNVMVLNAGESVFHGQEKGIGVGSATTGICLGQPWHRNYPTRLSIVAGEDYGEFVDGSGRSLGHEFTGTSGQIAQIRYRANGVEPDSISERVTIQAESRGTVRTATFEVVRSSPSRLWLDMEAQGDVSYGAEMFLAAQTFDMYKRAMAPEEGVTYTFELTEGMEYGSLFKGSQEGTRITGIRPDRDFLYEGYASIGFWARKAEPIEPQRVSMEVTASDPEIHPAGYSFNVLPSPLAIDVDPPVVAYGQGATIRIRKKEPDGSITDWPPDAWLSYEIVAGKTAGYILLPDTSLRRDTFDGESSMVRFVALEESPQPDTVEVVVYVSVGYEGTPGLLPAGDGTVASSLLGIGTIPPNPSLRRT